MVVQALVSDNFRVAEFPVQAFCGQALLHAKLGLLYSYILAVGQTFVQLFIVWFTFTFAFVFY